MSQTGPFKLAVFGRPVAHSLSPRIHRLFAEQFGIDVDYDAIEAGIDALPERLATFRADGGTGANLTVPLKQAALTLCAGLDPAARRANAVNTLRLDDAGWQGFNTDGEGLMLDLERLGLAVSGRRVLIVGAGGAVAGILGELLAGEPARVCIVNRSAERARALAARFAPLGEIEGAGFDCDPGGPFDLLVQSTSAGHESALPPLRDDWLAAGAAVYDLNYGPAHRPLADWCRTRGVTAHDGLGMLVGQAARSFAIWTGRRPRIEPVVAQLTSR